MSDTKEQNTKGKEEAGKSASEMSVGGKPDPNFLEEDDEFEEFIAEDWQGKDGDEREEDVNVWEDNWDDESVEDDFSKQLRAELEKHGMKPGEVKR